MLYYLVLARRFEGELLGEQWSGGPGEWGRVVARSGPAHGKAWYEKDTAG